MTDLRFLFENLFINKYDLKYVKRPEKSVMQVIATKKDDFGFDIYYHFFFLANLLPETTVSRYKKAKENQLFIGCTGQDGADLTEHDFYEKLNTLIDPGVYLNPDLQNILDTLGHNRLPAGMTGKPDDLLETYVKECLQFLLIGKGRRYGKDRSFESLPDGAILGKDLTILFDAKAYGGGYNPSADDLKRFQSYINDFNNKYGHFTNKVFSFIVVSGHFDVGESALEDRSRELYEMCQTTLTFITAQDLAQMVSSLLTEILSHPSINWKKICVKPVPRLSELKSQIDAIKKDKIT